MAKNEVATTEKNFNLVTLTGELKEAVAEELDGLGTLPFERAKIPSGGLSISRCFSSHHSSGD